MLATAHKLYDRLAIALLLASLAGLTVGNGALVALITIAGDCSGGGSSGCVLV